MSAADQHNRDEGYVGISQAARLAGMPTWLMRRRLKSLHRRHGQVLFRFTDGKNSKLWTTPQALRRVMPERFDEVSELDLIELRTLLLEAQHRIAREERKRAVLEQRMTAMERRLKVA
jgi:hypothetical protein